MAIYKKLTLAVLVLISVKAIGVIRELVFIWYLGVNNETSLIMMMNVIPAALSGLLRYSSINLLIHLKFSKQLNQSEIDYQIQKLFLIILFILFLIIPFSGALGIKQIFAYLLYTFAAILYAAVGYEEYGLLGKSERLKIALAALIGTVLSIMIVVFGSEFLNAFVLPVATLTSAVVNYLLIPSKSSLFKKRDGKTNIKQKNLMSMIISLAPIIFIEIIGMMLSVADLIAIKLWGLDPVVFQYNYYASMIYSLPVMIVGMAISSQLLDLGRINLIDKIFEKNTYIITSSILIVSAAIYLAVSYTSVGFYKLLKIIYPEMRMNNVEEIVNLFNIYSAGILPAIFVFAITKIFLSKYSAGKIALVYSIVLPVKFSVLAIGSCFSTDIKEIIPFSTVIGWTILVLTFAACARYGKFK